MTNPNSRFSRVDTPALAPGCDFITQTPVGPFIDTHFDVPFEKRGRLYLSSETVREMALELGLFAGMVPASNVDDAYDRGYAEGVKENFRGNLVRARDDIADALDGVDRVLADSAVPVGAEQAAV